MSQNKIIAITGLIISSMYGFAIKGVSNAGPTFLSGTKIFPIIVVSCTLLLSIIIFLQDFGKEKEVRKLKLDKKVLITMGLCTLVFLVYTFIFERAGFILSTILMLIGLLSIINKGKIKVNLTIAIIFPVIVYSVFVKLLAISLPMGIIHF